MPAPETCSVNVVGRGEDVEYREGARVLHASIGGWTGPPNPTVELDLYALTHWSTPEGVSLTEQERRRVIEHVSRYLASRGVHVILLQEPPPPYNGLRGRDVIDWREANGIS